MGLGTVDVKAFDPNLITGIARVVAGPTRIRAVTPGTPYGEFATWLYVGVTGDVNITCWDGTTITMKSMAAGIWHRVGSTSVNLAGTTATNLLWGS